MYTILIQLSERATLYMKAYQCPIFLRVTCVFPLPIQYTYKILFVYKYVFVRTHLEKIYATLMKDFSYEKYFFLE